MSELVSVVSLCPGLSATDPIIHRLNGSELVRCTPESSTGAMWLRALDYPDAKSLDPLWHTQEGKHIPVHEVLLASLGGVTTGMAAPDPTIAHLYYGMQQLQHTAAPSEFRENAVTAKEVEIVGGVIAKLYAQIEENQSRRVGQLQKLVPEGHIALAGIGRLENSHAAPLHYVGILEGFALVEQHTPSSPPRNAIEPLIRSTATNKVGLFPAGLHLSRTLYSAAQLRKITRAES